jgi:large subunit ribosomal protein L16
MFEMRGPAPEVAKEAMRLAQHKLPIRSRFIVREGFVYVPPTKAAASGPADDGHEAEATGEAEATPVATEVNE